MTAQEATATGIERLRIPAKKPAAQAPAAPFSASSVCRWLATMDSVKANVKPMAANVPMVPPLLVRKPDAPLVCDPNAFCTALTKAPTPAPCRPTTDAYWRDGFSSKLPSVGGSVVVCGFSAIEAECQGRQREQVLSPETHWQARVLSDRSPANHGRAPESRPRARLTLDAQPPPPPSVVENLIVIVSLKSNAES